VADHERFEELGAAAVVVTVSGQGRDGFAVAGDDPARSLRSWLVDADELRGRVHTVESSPRLGELGAWVDALAVVLAPGGAAAVLAGAVLSWMRCNRADLRVTLRRGDGEQAEVEVKRLRGLDAASLPAVIEALRRWLDGDTPAVQSRAELENASGGAVRAAGGDGGNR
jgi:hypothetical protein